MNWSRQLLVLAFAMLFISTAYCADGPRVVASTTSKVASPVWGNDIVVWPTEPTGPLAGVALPTGQAFVCVPDTSGSSHNIRLLQSTDFGDTWTSPAYLIFPNTAPVRRCRNVHTSGDTAYSAILWNGIVWIYRFNTFGLLYQFDSSNVVDFDIEGTSSGTLHLFAELPDNQILRYASTDGGVSWRQTGVTTSAGSQPRVRRSNTGDTLMVAFYQRSSVPKEKSAIRLFFYREPSPTMLTYLYQNRVVRDTVTTKTEFVPAMNNGNAWLFYSSGDMGGIDVMCSSSRNSGGTFDTTYAIAGRPDCDEYWLDAGTYGNGHVELCYYQDSLAATTTNSSDCIVDLYATGPGPDIWSTRHSVSDHPPFWSANGYSPVLLEYHNAGSESGILWVGLDGTQPRVYYDRYTATPTAVAASAGGAAPSAFRLEQNWPNPCNPSTTIAYQVGAGSRQYAEGSRQKDGAGVQVKLAVYDLLGREVAVLVNGYQTPGEHRVVFNGSTLASGVYFYRLVAEEQTLTKRLVLLK